MGGSVAKQGRRLTPEMRSRKLQALDFIKRYIAQWGQSPSIGEVGAALGVSRKRAHELIHQLAREEMIRHARGKTRGISLIDRGEEISEADMLLRLASDGWKVVQEDGTLTKNGLTGLPFLDHDPDNGEGSSDGAKPG